MAIPSFNAFNRLNLQAQLALTLMEGTYLANRHNGEGDRINLYYMDSYFVEVFYDPEVNYLHKCRTFLSTEPLEAYIGQIQLPNL